MRQIYVFALTFFGVKNVTSSPLYHETLGKGSPVTMQEISTTRPLLVLSVDFSTLTTSGGARTTSWNWADSGDPENMIESYCCESANDFFAHRIISSKSFLFEGLPHCSSRTLRLLL